MAEFSCACLCSLLILVSHSLWLYLLSKLSLARIFSSPCFSFNRKYHWRIISSTKHGWNGLPSRISKWVTSLHFKLSQWRWGSHFTDVGWIMGGIHFVLRPSDQVKNAYIFMLYCNIPYSLKNFIHRGKHSLTVSNKCFYLTPLSWATFFSAYIEPACMFQFNCNNCYWLPGDQLFDNIVEMMNLTELSIKGTQISLSQLAAESLKSARR